MHIRPGDTMVRTFVMARHKWLPYESTEKEKNSFVHNIRLVIVVLRTISSTRTETFISNIRIRIVVDNYYMARIKIKRPIKYTKNVYTSGTIS